jgi:hypothetical protein
MFLDLRDDLSALCRAPRPSSTTRGSTEIFIFDPMLAVKSSARIVLNEEVVLLCGTFRGTEVYKEMWTFETKAVILRK